MADTCRNNTCESLLGIGSQYPFEGLGYYKNSQYQNCCKSTLYPTFLESYQPTSIKPNEKRIGTVFVKCATSELFIIVIIYYLLQIFFMQESGCKLSFSFC